MPNSEPLYGDSKPLLWRVRCVLCRWTGYRATGPWTRPHDVAFRLHPAGCPRCGNNVVGLSPKVGR